ncbi:MAG: hypothetical protein AAF657_18120 [Acidobacteriota bacterium]
MPWRTHDLGDLLTARNATTGNRASEKLVSPSWLLAHTSRASSLETMPFEIARSSVPANSWPAIVRPQGRLHPEPRRPTLERCGPVDLGAV